MSETLSISDARAELPSVVDRVEAGAEITLTRHGKPVAVLIAPERLRVRRASAEVARKRAVALGRDIEAAGGQPIPSSGISAEQADERVAELRGDRDSDRG